MPEIGMWRLERLGLKWNPTQTSPTFIVLDTNEVQIISLHGSPPIARYGTHPIMYQGDSWTWSCQHTQNLRWWLCHYWFFLVLFASSLSFQEDDIACFLGNDNSNCRCDIKNLLFYSLVNKSMKMIIVLKQNKGGKRYELSKAYLMSDIIIGYN